MTEQHISLEIAPSSGVPIYRQIIEQVRRMVASKQLKPGAELPSVRSVAQSLAVNPMTISKAYSLLEAEGVLQRQRGKGMIVSSNLPESQSEDQRLHLLQPAIEQIITEARQLEIGRETLLKEIKARYKE
ncbi:MAG: GntR family transcriptional regulator [Gammaproteobacteria bacterium]|nr:GntR family transcriptional regulator [Gammaproteobacteria bacterium]NVK88191.1 GntR family transcriptional regulator [Gammaproteobacteria bacterium]